ncbi:RDD family protein [Neisseria wadsworthii]|uniref:Branched-chain amino acid aminotransferase I n=1 Tax=Neisseria wadsworthii 9715 TaxID=1030841 RepID=G4CLY8_9NEIS|nr:RDD family protein [Neisseria wadsworthii]EGZ51346.1 branched-chain amino acid aminotransferase I [Neisseria wadsworthii 9715]QMT36162.1 RDD family protein [Neisseria wadsworthii]
MNYAGFWIRTVAVIIDTIILMIVILPLMYLIYGDAYFAVSDEIRYSFGFWDTFLNHIFPAIFTLFFWNKFAATPGKMLLALKVVDAKTGEDIDLRQSIIRYIGYFIAILPLFLGLIWVAFDKRKQGWHDKMAGTVIVRK